MLSLRSGARFLTYAGYPWQYARLYATPVVDAIAGLALPRYGLGEYVTTAAEKQATAEEKRVLANLARAGRRLMGFSRTNLFKRLESSGQAFLQSLERHVLRNYIFLHAIDTGLPISPQDASLLDSRIFDADADAVHLDAELLEDAEEGIVDTVISAPLGMLRHEADGCRGDRRLGRSDEPGLALQPREQRATRPDPARAGAARAGGHRCAQRGPEFPGRPYCGQLRPALGQRAPQAGARWCGRGQACKKAPQL